MDITVEYKALYASKVFQSDLHPAGLVNFLIAPLFGALHITTALGVNIAPGLNKVSKSPRFPILGHATAIFSIEMTNATHRVTSTRKLCGAGYLAFSFSYP